MKKKRKKKKLNISKIILLLTFTLMITVCIGVLLNSSFFNVKSIEITGAKKLTEKDVSKYLDTSLNKNIFMQDIKSIEKDILKEPYVKSANIKRKLPNKLSISIKEKEAIAMLRDNNNYCYIDKEYKVLEKTQEKYEDIDKIIVDIDYNINDDEQIEFKNEDTKKKLLYLLESINNKGIYKKIKTINLKKDDIINIMTVDSTKILLPNEEELDYNISRIGKILVDLQSKNMKNGTIDLTYSNYAVYSP